MVLGHHVYEILVFHLHPGEYLKFLLVQPAGQFLLMVLVRVQVLDLKELVVGLVQFPWEESFVEELELMLVDDWKVLEELLVVFLLLVLVELGDEVVNHGLLVLVELGDEVVVFVSF